MRIRLNAVTRTPTLDKFFKSYTDAGKQMARAEVETMRKGMVWEVTPLGLAPLKPTTAAGPQCSGLSVASSLDSTAALSAIEVSHVDAASRRPWLCQHEGSESWTKRRTLASWAFLTAVIPLDDSRSRSRCQR
jgi:hypothetical protein